MTLRPARLRPVLSKADVVEAWQKADPKYIHPTREHESEDAYWESGHVLAREIAKFVHFGDSILDFGCGDGRVTVPLVELGYKVVAVDSNAAFLEGLAEKLDPGERDNVTVWQGDEDDLPDVQVDAVVCMAVLIHHDWYDGERIVAALVEKLKPGGLFIAHWPTSEEPRERRTWIQVTTWSEDRQDAVTAALGLERVPGLDEVRSVWRKRV